jgi:pyridoxal 5'-phosphate synthase pdxT subunit
MKIGILDLQGCVLEHLPHLKSLNVEVLRVRTLSELQKIDGLIIPGGESSTQLKLIETFQLRNALVKRASEIPFWGICAGAILMATKVTNPEQDSLGLIPIAAERNSYGRQLESSVAILRNVQVAFIRAPRLSLLENSSSHDLLISESFKGDAVHIRDPQTKHQVSSFHPELSDVCPSPFHVEFVDICRENAKIRTQSPTLSH